MRHLEIFFVTYLLLKFCEINCELWEQELGKEVYIEASVEGLDSVKLACTSGIF